MRNVSDETFRENKNKYFMFSNSPPPSENRTVYEIMWKDTVEKYR